MAERSREAEVERALRSLEQWADYEELDKKTRVLSDAAKAWAAGGEEARRAAVEAVMRGARSGPMTTTQVCFRVLAELGDDSPRLIDFLGSYVGGEINRSGSAIDALAKMAETSEAALSALIARSTHPEAEQKIGYALMGIQRSAPSIAAAFLKALGSPNEYVRKTAFEFFTKHPEHAASTKDRCVPLLKDSSSRLHALKLLRAQGVDVGELEPSEAAKFRRRYVYSWLHGASGGVLTLWPVRMTIGLALCFGGWYLGNGLGYPRLGTGIGLAAAYSWILSASGASLGSTTLNLVGPALALGWIYWKVYRFTAGIAMPASAVWPFALFLVVWDALGAHASMRLDLRLDRFCPACGGRLGSEDLMQVHDDHFGGGRIVRSRRAATIRRCECGYS